MKNLESKALRRVDGKLSILNQRLLPHQEEWLEVSTPDEMIRIIRELSVRGAPLIGVAAALTLAAYAQGDVNEEQIIATARALNGSRPTAVNLMAAMDRMVFLNTDRSPKQLMRIAEQIFEEDVQLCDRMANYGAGLIEDGDAILTHCNTGGLATAGVGTALGVIARAHEQGKKIHVYVDETRPLLQGGRLTTWELKKLEIPYTLICDSMAATLMREGKINKVFVGADRIAINGDFANKIGTYAVAVMAKHHAVPFYPVAPYTTIDFSIACGQEIPIEQRAFAEVAGVAGYFNSGFQEIAWAQDNASVYNPAFDVTPVELVTAMVLDSGVISNADLLAGRIKKLKSTKE